MNSTRKNGIAGHSLDHDSEMISSERRGELPPDPDATLGKSHDREFIGNCGDHGSTKTQWTSTANHSKHSDKSKSTREGDKKAYKHKWLVGYAAISAVSEWEPVNI